MAIEAVGPDNKTYEFPDGTSRDQMVSYFKKHFPPQQQVNDDQPTEQLDQYEDNTGLFSYFEDIVDRENEIKNAINYFNELEKIDPNINPNEYHKVQSKFKNAVELANQYSRTDKDNIFTQLGKELGADVTAILAGGGAGAAAGSLAGPVGTAVGGAFGAGTVGFERSRKQHKVYNAYRELVESGDLTPEELDGAARTAIGQAVVDGSIDAMTAGAASVLPKVGHALVRRLGVNAVAGAGGEVASDAMQRAYVSNLEVLGEGALEEYIQSATIGAIAQTALGGGFEGLNYATNKFLRVETADEIRAAADKVDPDVYNATLSELQADFDDNMNNNVVIEKDFAIDESKRGDVIEILRKPRDAEGAEIHANLARAFGDSLDKLIALNNLSNENLISFSKTDAYQGMMNAQKQIIDKAIFDKTEADMSILGDIETPENLMDTTTIAGAINAANKRLMGDEYGPGYEAAQFRNLLDAPVESKRKPPSNPIEQVRRSFLDKAAFMFDAPTLARHDPEVANIQVFARAKENTRERMWNDKSLLQKGIKEEFDRRGVFNEVHEATDMLSQNDARRDVDGRWTYADPKTGSRVKLGKQLSRDVDTLQEYYNADYKSLHGFLMASADSLQKAGDPEAAKAFIERAKRVEEQMRDIYLPQMRFGTLWTKVGDSVYSLEQVTGADALNRSELMDIGNGIKVSKTEYAQMRNHIKNETGVDIGPKPKFTKDTAPGDGQLFRRQRGQRLQNADMDRLLGDEELLSSLSDTDNTKLKELRNAQNDGILDAILQRKRNVPGYSRDWGKVFDSNAKGKSDMISTYMYLEPYKDLMKQYELADGHSPSSLAEKYWHRLHAINPDHSRITDAAARMQAVLGLGFNPSTAVLQTATLVSSLPAMMSVMSANPVSVGKYIGIGVRDAGKLVQLTDDLSDPKVLMKVLKDKELVDFIVENPTIVGNSPKQDFISGTQGSRPIGEVANKVEEGAYWMLLKMEKLTRLAGVIATHKMARNPKYQKRAMDAFETDNVFQDWLRISGRDKAADLITKSTVTSAYGLYGRSGWAGIQSGFGRILMPFATYPLQITNTMLKLMSGMRGRRAQIGAFSTIAGMGVTFGLAGMPFYEVLESIYNGFNRFILGQNKRMDKETFDAIYEVNPELARFLQSGVIGEATGVDFARRVSIGNPYNAYTNFLMGEGPTGRDIGFLLPKAYDFKEALQKGDALDIIKAASPNAVGNLVKGMYDYDAKGIATKSGGVIKPSDDITSMEKAQRVFGFNPITAANAQKAYYHGIMDQQKYRPLKQRKVKKAYPYFKKYIESGQTDSEALRKLKLVLEELENAYERNGDEFTGYKRSGFMRSLKLMYQNEKYGFTGGKPKSNFNKQTQRDAIEYYRNLEGGN
jgi:hypothetical protein